MIIEYLRYRIRDGGHADFEAAYRRAAKSLAAAKQCQDYELARAVDEPGSYILRIGWTSAEDHLKGFRGGPEFAAFFAEIRPYVEQIEEMRHYERTDVAGSGGAVPTLYEWAGGAAALTRLTEAFYAKVPEDDLLAEVFAGMSPEHPAHVAVWLGEVFGGPAAYTGQHGGHAHMIARHAGRAITEPQRRRWVSLLLATADEVGLPADPEFRAALAGYLEWGSRLAVVFSAPDAGPAADQPVPCWGWGSAPPWTGS
ncbi:antibiotic biosynthesis monooxygenase [Amycolatopsis sp. AA4]|uniref:globin domain-containing protein n=1 Tax=Actinomycetes TaxID=1760 RepID=UPI0001B565F8|nr:MULTISPECIES: antibiotic biosynthesis monooxygenase [Actinomycetes]ATY13176.1 antibiotic biosynthesis monooxygenase [Amycolatopsis sp. AA4]